MHPQEEGGGRERERERQKKTNKTIAWPERAAHTHSSWGRSGVGVGGKGGRKNCTKKMFPFLCAFSFFLLLLLFIWLRVLCRVGTESPLAIYLSCTLQQKKNPALVCSVHIGSCSSSSFSPHPTPPPQVMASWYKWLDSIYIYFFKTEPACLVKIWKKK